jgi:alpha-mannosidase
MSRTARHSIIVLVATASILLTSAACSAQRRFYIAPDDHTDYYWTADGNTYRQAFLSMVDYYLDRMDATAGNPSDTQMRWNCDGSLWMWEYEHNRSPIQFSRFLDRIRDGHMSVALNPLVLVQGGSPAEAVLRGMYYPGLVERRNNVHFPVAIAMEDQTLPYGLPSLWAGAGAKYSWKGVCNCATHVPGLENRDREIYYAGGRDGSRVLMKWNSQFANSQNFGGYAEAYDPLASIGLAENNSNFQTKYPFPVIGAFGAGWDGLQYMSDEFVTVAQQNSNQNRRIIVSNQQDFFQDFETNHGAGLETFAAAYGNEWDALIASMAELSAKVKRSTEKLRSAEAMATLVSLNDRSFMDTRTAQRDKAMLDLGLYFEHDWTADGPVSQTIRANWSRSVAAEISSYVDKLHEDARLALAQQINRSGANPRFYVFNPLSWTRTDVADIKLRLDRRVHVIDVSTGQEVPSQVVRSGNFEVLRIIAQNVPAVGYKVYEIRDGAPAAFAGGPTAAGTVIENAFYRLTLANDGAITSIIDKTRGDRETVRNISGKVVNDLGGNRSGRVVVESIGPVSVTLRAESTSPLAHTTHVTLYRDIDRVDVTNEITQNFGNLNTWSFSLNLNSPDTRHEEVGAVIRAKLLANGGHYSPGNARYDWLTMNHFADVSDGATGNFGVTISNADASFMKLGASTAATLDTVTPQINVLAGGQIDGPSLGIANQGGDSYLMQRFALRDHGAFSQTAAMKFALEHQNPFVTAMLSTGTTEAVYPEDNFSFLNISDPNVLLWALKPAEDGVSRGIIARVWNQGNLQTNYTLSLSQPIMSADRVTHIETTIAPATIIAGQLNASISQQQIQTHLLRLAAGRRSDHRH